MRIVALALTLMVAAAACQVSCGSVGGVKQIRSVPEATEFSTLVISEPPGARIEINDEYVGDAPLYVELPQYRYGGRLNRRILMRATPKDDGQAQVKVLANGAEIPQRMLFDTRAPAKKDDGDIQIIIDKSESR